MISVKFDNIYTFSKYYVKENKYTQFKNPDKTIEAKIPIDLGRIIIELNLNIISPLVSDHDVNRDAIKKNVDKLYEKLLTYMSSKIPDGETFKGFNVYNTLAHTKQLFIKICCDATILKCCHVFEQYRERTNKDLQTIKRILQNQPFENGIAHVKDEYLSRLIRYLMKINGVVYPKYTSGLLPFLMTEAYIMMAEYDEGIAREQLMKTALFSHFQKILFDTDVDDAVHEYFKKSMCGSNPFNDRTLCNMYPTFSLKKKSFTMTKLYEQTAAKPKELKKFCDTHGIDINLDLIPYVFGSRLPKNEQMYHYLLHRIDIALRQNATIAEIVRPELANFKIHFDSILFPKRQQVVDIHNSIKQTPGFNENEIINPNDFNIQRGDALMEILSTVVMTMFKSDHGPITEQMLREKLDKLPVLNDDKK